MSALPWPFSSGAELGDLEAPNALAQAAAGVARTVVSTETGVLQRELVMLATAPDQTSIQMTLNAIASLAMVGLDKHVLLLADSATTCASFSQPCYWSSRVLTNAPGPKAIVQAKFWDWRFRYYYVKKAYLSRLVRLGFSVIQADTDTIWEHDPFPMLRSMSSSLVVMVDSELANAGLIYTRPGSREAVDILDEVAWRIQLLQNYPEMAGAIVPYAKPPYYVRGAQPPRAGLGFPKRVQRPSLRVWRPSRNRPPPDRRATRRQTPTTRRSCATSCGRPCCGTALGFLALSGTRRGADTRRRARSSKSCPNSRIISRPGRPSAAEARGYLLSCRGRAARGPTTRTGCCPRPTTRLQSRLGGSSRYYPTVQTTRSRT